jgi:hypothetical protein
MRAGSVSIKLRTARGTKLNRAILLNGGCSMADLHHTHDPRRDAGIDAMGWLFSAVVVAILLVAAVIAYEAHEAAPAPVSQIVAR